jgi:hypothetical protein
MKNRRQFLVASSLAAVAAAVPKSLFAMEQQRLGGDVFSNASLEPYLQGEMTQANFEKVVGSTFTIFLDNDQVDYLRLRSVTSGSDAMTNASTKPVTAAAQKAKLATAALQPTSFLLHFDFGGPGFPQDSYLLDHGTMGRFALFLVPGSAQKCVATFCTIDSVAVAAPISAPRGTLLNSRVAVALE